MATLSQATLRFSEGLVVPRPIVFLHARTLREEDETLFPRDPLGRNRAVHLTPPPLVNLLMSVASADPITSAPRLVRAWRQAAYCPPMSEILDEKLEQQPILPGQNLGLDLETLINLLARPSKQEQRIRAAFSNDFRVTLTVGEALAATVERPSLNLINEYQSKENEVGLSKKQTINLQGRERQAVPMQRIVHLDFIHFEIAAELWTDSLAHGAVYEPSLLKQSSGGPNETAAAWPGNDNRPLPKLDPMEATWFGS